MLKKVTALVLCLGIVFGSLLNFSDLKNNIYASGSSISIINSVAAPIIDGIIDSSYRQVIDITPSTAGLVLGQGGIDFPESDLTGTNNANVNEQGLSARVYLSWDDNNLYFISKCTDKTIQSVAGTSQDYLATDNRLYFKSGSTIKTIKFINTANGVVAMSAGSVLSNVMSTIKLEDTYYSEEYSIEAKIPWSEMGITLEQAKTDLGFNFVQTSSKSTSIVNSVIYSKYNYFGTTDEYFQKISIIPMTTIDGVKDDSYIKIFDFTPNTAGLVLGQGGIDFPESDLTGTNNANVVAQNLSAKVYMNWDNNNLYFFSDCTDNTIQAVSGANAAYLATDNRVYLKSGDTIKNITFINTTSGTLAISEGIVISDVESKISINGTHYSIEARIPWSTLGISKAQADSDFRVNFVQTSSKSTSEVNSVIYSQYNYFGTSNDYFKEVKIKLPEILRSGAYHISPNKNYSEFIKALDFDWINCFILEGAEPSMISDALDEINQRGKKAFILMNTALSSGNKVLRSDWQSIFDNVNSICNASPGKDALEGWYYDEPLISTFTESDFITVTDYGKNTLHKRNLAVFSVPEFDKSLVSGNCPEISDANIEHITDIAYDSYDASLAKHDKIQNAFESRIQNRRNDIRVWYIPPIGITFDSNWFQYYNLRILEQYLGYMKQDVNVGGVLFYTWETNVENGLTEGNGKYYLMPKENGVTPWNCLQKAVTSLGKDIVQGKALSDITFANMDVPSTATAPTINGVKDASYVQVINFTPSEAELVYGQGGIDFPEGDLTGTNNTNVNNQGLSAKAFFTWDNNNLYFYSECTDKTIKTVSSANYAHLATDNRLFFKSGKITKNINFIKTSSGAKAISNGSVLSAVTSYIKTGVNKYSFEAKIPWTTLGITVNQAKADFKVNFAQTSSKSTTQVNSVISARYNYFGTTSEYFDAIKIK